MSMEDELANKLITSQMTLLDPEFRTTELNDATSCFPTVVRPLWFEGQIVSYLDIISGNW